MRKVIAINVINEVRRLCVEDALLFALFLRKVKKKEFCEKVSFSSDELRTLRVGRSVTRLTVYWASPYWSGS